MAYIGAEPVPGQNREVDDISSGFNGNATAFTLQVNSVNVSPESAKNILVNLGGVLQNPDTDYTINASTLTFTTAPASGLSFFGLILGAGINTATVADGAITTAKLASDAVGANQLANTSVTAGSYTTADITVDAQGRITAAASGTISGAEIADQAVTNAKVNNSAAIAGSKISPDFGSQNIVTTGEIKSNTLFESASGNDLRLNAGSANRDIFFQVNDSTLTTVQGSTGNVGIGTSSPSDKLHVRGASAAFTAFILDNATNSSSPYKITYGDQGQVNHLVVANRELTFGTNNAERVRIDSSGNVGIGTTSPAKLLDVKEESNGTVEQYLRNTVINLLSKINGTTSAQFGTETSHPLAFLTGNTERMRIDSSGNMLLGLTSTSFPKRLNVQGSSGAIIALKNNDTTSYAANTNTSIEFGLNTGNTGNQNGSCEIRAFKENGTNGNNARGLSFYTGGNGGSPTERLRIESNGFVSGTYKPVKTVKNTNQDHTTGERFVIPLPNTSRMFKIAGTFSWSGSGSGIIFADFGDWSDGHTVNIEGVALSFRNGASEDLDDLGNTRYQRMTPAAFDAYNLEIQYEIFITSQALQNGNDTGNNAGGGRPGAFGHIRFTHSQIGVALTTFTFQDINATGTDRLQSFAWDIDGSTGNLGSGEHTYVLEEYPLT
jgi:hypothetical protein